MAQNRISESFISLFANEPWTLYCQLHVLAVTVDRTIVVLPNQISQSQMTAY